MDSPIFGSQKSYQNSRPSKNAQFFTKTSQFASNDWYLTNKSHSNLGDKQISNELKFSYTLIVLQLNTKSLFAKLNKCLNIKKSQGFVNIVASSIKYTSSDKKEVTKQQNPRNLFQRQQNPQKKSFELVCLAKINRKLSDMFQIVKRVQIKKIAKAWRQLYFNFQKSKLVPGQMRMSSCMETESIHLGLCSKIQQQKRLNSKKHAKQMKQNSLLNRTGSQNDQQTDKLAQQIMTDQYNFQKFTEEMGNLLALHQNRFAASQRDTITTEKPASQKTYQSKQFQGDKNGLNKKK